jgi:alkylated DNA repair dioxygenase AlkB
MLALFATRAAASVFLEAMAQQMGLFGTAPRVFADGETGGIVYYPGVFSAEQSATWFDKLERSLTWAEETMWMYDRTVEVPRLIARFPPGEAQPPIVAEIKQRIEAFLKETFTSVSFQYYRDGSDSVAWHNDHREELVPLPTIALLSLGATREMLVRTKARPRRTYSCDLEPGSLFVMSGRAQEFWEHQVPKVKRPIRPRISVALRQRKV